MSNPICTEEKYKEFHRLQAREKTHNEWRKAAAKKLMKDLAPRIYRLGTRSYPGYGFHYGMVNTLGKLISSVAIPIQISMNHQGKWEQCEAVMDVDPVMLECLEEEVMEAEAASKPRRKKKVVDIRN